MIDFIRFYYMVSLYLLMSVGFFLSKADVSFSNSIISGFVFINSFILFLFVLYKDSRLTLNVFVLTSIFLILLFPSLFGGGDVMYMADKVMGFWLIPLLYSTLFLYVFKTDGLKAIRYFILSSLFILLLTIIYKLQFGFFVRSTRYFLNGSIVFSWNMGVACILSYFHATNSLISNRYEKKICSLLTVIFFLAVFWGFSKGPILALLVVILLIFMCDKITFKRTLYLFSGLFLIFVLLYNYQSEPVVGRMLNVFTNDSGALEVGSVQARYQLYMSTLNLIKDNVIYGVGLAEWASHIKWGGATYPHNFLLELLSELGVVITSIILLYYILLIFNLGKVFFFIVSYLAICMLFSGDMTYLRFLNSFIIIGFFIPRGSCLK